jgi:hypothetical protein
MVIGARRRSIVTLYNHPTVHAPMLSDDYGERRLERVPQESGVLRVRHTRRNGKLLVYTNRRRYYGGDE